MDATPSRGVLTCEEASPRDDPDLRRLLRETPMGHRMAISLQSEPSFFDARAVEGDRHHAVVVRDPETGAVVAMGARSVRRVYVNGRPARLGYLGQLRIDARYRRRPSLLRAGFARLAAARAADELPFDLTSIVRDNRAARRLLGAGVRGLPRYRPLARYVTLACGCPIVSVRRLGRRRLRAERGGPGSLEEIAACLRRNLARYQFAPRWTADDLRSTRRTRGLRPRDFLIVRRGGRVVGCAAHWDQRGFRQAVVRGYAASLARWRWALNLAGAPAGLPALPAEGATVPAAFMSHLAVDDDDLDVLDALVIAVRRSARAVGARCLISGHDLRDPLLARLRRVPHRAVFSILYTVGGTVGGDPPALDDRPCQPEAALL